jgi:beta-galactosidase
LAPEELRGKVVRVEFDGVYESSEIWINGHLLGTRPFGYIGFSYEVTRGLNFGATANVIAVRVDNSFQPNSRWYSGSGINRHTWLSAADYLAIEPERIFVDTPVVSRDLGVVQVATQVKNGRDQAAKFSVVSTLVDRDGQELQAASSQDELGAGESGKITQQIRVENPRLWSVANPYLYMLRSELREGDRVVDRVQMPIGIRSAVFDVDRGFLLNGQPVKLNGVCLHGDGGSVGSAVPIGVWRRRLELLKQMGCNAIRTSHNPPAPEFLDLCDQMGFLVMDEAFDEWTAGKTVGGYHRFFDEWSQKDLVDFIHRDRNHPCVVLWSAGNEIQEQVLPGGADVLRPLVKTFHREDPTRLVTAACDKIFAEPISAPPEFVGLLDVVGYNYVDRWLQRAGTYYSEDRAQFPQRRFVGTESVSMGGIRGDYRGWFAGASTQPAVEILLPATTMPGGPRRRFRPPPPTNRQVDVEQLYKFVRANDYVSGDFMWTGIDYLGEAFWPARSASFGVMDTCGFKKDGYYFYQSQWTSKPMVHLFPHWNWRGHEGEIIPVMAYTNCDTVELVVNGKSFGVKGYEFPRHGMMEDYGNYPPRAREVRTTADLHLEWDVPYEPGTVRAIGRVNGKVVATEEIHTTGEAAGVVISADKNVMMADARDVVHITARIVDSEGSTVPTSDNEITFAIDGPAKLIGVDNGNPVDHTGFKVNHVKAFGGLCLAIVQGTRESGTIRISASSPGLKGAGIEISSGAGEQELFIP